MHSDIQYARVSLSEDGVPLCWVETTDVFESVFCNDNLLGQPLEITLSYGAYTCLCKCINTQKVGRIRVFHYEAQRPYWLNFTHKGHELWLHLEKSADVDFGDVEQQTEQEILKSVLNLLPSPVFIKDQEHRLILTNARFDAFIGSEESPLGKTDYDLFPESIARHCWDIDDVVMQSGQESIEEDVVKLPNGEELWTLTHKIPTDLTNGETGIVGIITDITARKKAEREVLLSVQKRDEAILSNQAKSRFLANVSHEFRTPLNAIIGYTELMQDEALPNNLTFMYKDMDKILRAAGVLLGLIDEVLDLSTIEAGKMRLQATQFELGPLLQEVEELIYPTLNKQDVTFTTHMPAAVIVMHTDRKRLKQILSNLYSNAIKFTQQGAVDVKIEQHEQFIDIQVHDTGMGIPTHRLLDIFATFERNEMNVSTIQGTGLGLPLARYLSQLMGGDIFVSSEEDVGSIFTIHMPQNMSQASIQEPLPETSLARLNFLVIGKDHTFCDTLRRYSSELHVDLFWASNVERGLKLASLQNPTAIVFDVANLSESTSALIELSKHHHFTSSTIILAGSNHSDLNVSIPTGVSVLKKPVSNMVWAKLIQCLREDMHEPK